ncbi:MAG: MFS transporter [Chloroflexota bacterium]
MSLTRGHLSPTFSAHPIPTEVNHMTEIPLAANHTVNTPAPRQSRRWPGLFALAFGTVSDGQEFQVLNALFPMIRTALGLNYTALSLFNAVNDVARILFQPLWAIVATRTNRKMVLVLFTGLWGIWSMLAGLSNSFWGLMLFFSLAMIGVAASGGIIPAVISDLFPDEERSSAFGVYVGIATITALIITPALAVLTGIEAGWRYGFFLIGCLSLLSGLFIWLFLDDPGQGASEVELAAVSQQIQNQIGFGWADLRELFRTKSFVRFVLPHALDSNRVVFTFLVVYMVDALGISNASAVVLLVPVIAGVMLGSLAGAFLIGRIQAAYPRYGRLGTFVVLLSLALVATIFGTQFRYETTLIYSIAFACWGVAKGGLQTVSFPVLHAVLPPEKRGPATALAESARACVTLITGLLVGVLSDRFGLQLIFSLIVVGGALLQLMTFLFILPVYQQDVTALHEHLEARSRELEETT